MATLIGELVAGGLGLMPNSPVSNVMGCAPTIDAFRAAKLTPMPDTGVYTNTRPRTTALISREPKLPNRGEYVEMHGQELFEKIVVNPRSKSLGFVLTTIPWTTNVWNTHRSSLCVLTSIDVSGAGNILIANPYGLPLPFGPGQARDFATTAPQGGDATINTTISFAFPGESGATETISGSRITVFSLVPDWSAGFKERISYVTEVLSAYSDAEQRRGLRGSARRALSYRILTTDARSAALLDSLLWGWQHQPFGVPIWPEASRLVSDVAAGATSIPVDTTNRIFQAGGLALLWQDPFTFDAMMIAAGGVASNSLTITTPIQNAYKAGAKTLVVPMILARLKDDVSLSRYCSAGDEMDLEFDGEGSQFAPTFSGSWTQYKGFDVLEVAPNWKDNLSRKYKRSLVVLDSKTSGIAVDDKGGSPIVGTDLPWFAPSRASVVALRAFFDARKGQLKAFWMPTWDQDLVLAQDALSTDAAIRVQAVSYTRFFFPSPPRRYLAFLRPGQPGIYRQVTASSDNGDGTETITLDSALGVALSAKTTTVSFLTFVRLASDEVELLWTSTDLAEAVLSTAEVPRECP